MKQKGESLSDFLKRSQNEALARKSELLGFVKQTGEGLSVADLGAKISFLEGRLEVLRDVGFALESEDQ